MVQMSLFILGMLILLIPTTVMILAFLELIGVIELRFPWLSQKNIR